MAATVTSAFVLEDRASPTIRQIRRELRELQVDAKAAGRDLDQLSGPGIQRQMEAEAKSARSAARETDNLGKSADRAAGSTRRLEKRAKGLESQASRTEKSVGRLDKTVGRIAKWGAITTVVGGLVNMLGALAGGAIELLPRIGDLAGAGAGLGAVYVGAGAAMGTAKLATAGLSQALQGNKKALAGLTPDARAFVQELKSMRPELQTLRESAQRGLFGGAGNLLNSLRRQAPAINRIVSSTSSSLGGLANFAAGQVSQPGFMRDLGSVVGEGNTAFSAAGKSAIYLGRALEQVMIAAKPLVDWMSRMAVQESRLVLRHAELGRESGRLGRYFDRTKTSIQLFGQIGGRVLGGLRGVFHAASNDGDTLWRSIDRAAGRFDRWANSFSGQSTMRRYFRAIQPELRALGTTTGRLIKLFADLSGGTGGMTMTVRLVGDLASGADRLLRSLGPVGRSLGGILTTMYALHRLGALKLLGRAGGVAAAASGSSTLGNLFGGGGGIYGMRGITAKAGSLVNPIAVLVVDKGGAPLGIPSGGVRGGESETRVAAREARSAGGVILPAGVRSTAGAATTVEEAAAGGGSLLSRVGGIRAIGGRLLGGAGIAGTGMLVSQVGSQALSPVIGHKASSALGKVGTGASIGAGVGSIVPGIGTLAGAGIGALGGTVAALFGKGGPLAGKPVTARQAQAEDPGNMFGGSRYYLQQQQRQAASPAAQAKRELGQFDAQIKAVHGDLNRLSPAQLRALQREAMRLGNNPALGRYSRALAQVGTAAQNAIIRKANPAFRAMSKQAGKSLADIRLQAKINAAVLPTTLGKGSQAARVAVARSFALAADDVRKSMNAGVVSTKKGMAAINVFLSRELKALGVNISPQLAGVIGAKGVQALAKTAQTGRANTTGKSAQGGGSGHGATYAAGGRLPGPAIGDHIPLVSRGGGLLGVADGGELIVNRHTERDADSILGLFGTRLSRMVGNETRPHSRAFATGGRVVLDSGVNMQAGQEPAILSDLRKLSNELRQTVYVISGYRSPAHSVSVGGFADDPHTRGQAADIGVGSPTLASMFGVPERALKAVGLYRPFYPPQTSEANHVQLLGGGPSGKLMASTGGIGAVSVPTLKAPRVKGGGAVGAAAQGVLNMATSAANQYLQAHAPAAGSSGGPSGHFSGSLVQWLTQALKITGHYNPANLHALEGRAMQESTGNPRAINRWDSNAKAGHPSKGLLQTIDSTFNQYAMPGHTNIWNPVDNAIAAIRYMFADYGHVVGAGPGGYEMGGRLPQWGGWHAKGVDMTVRRPTIFGAGDNGPERVRVTPAGHSGVAINATARVNVQAGGISERRVRKLWDEYAQKFADEVAAEIASGPEEDEYQTIANGR